MDQGELAALYQRRLDRVDLEAALIDPGPNGFYSLRPLRMSTTGVVKECRRMAGNYYLHVHTLPHVASLLRVDGCWPAPIILSAGFFRARARPWNDTCVDPMVRLDRGGADFLRSVISHLVEAGAGSVYSPALYPNATGVWRRSRFQTHAELAVMERTLNRVPGRPAHEVSTADRPDWESVSAVDDAAFDGFWRMSRLALREAFETSKTSALLETFAERELVGYAIVGNQWGISYLHRIAVHPDHAGQGRGSSLLSAAAAWGRAHGGRAMVLNVRDVNKRAQALYERLGFSHTGTRLSVLRHQPSDMLN